MHPRWTTHSRKPGRYERLAEKEWWLHDSLVRHALWLRTGAPKTFKHHGAYEMFQELKIVFHACARVERYDTSDKFSSYKMEENSSISEHVLKMSRYYNNLNQLRVNLLDEVAIDRVL